MEKQAVIREGVTPSAVSGKKSEFIKNGNAFAKGEKDTITAGSSKLEKAMEAMYTGDK